MKPLLKITNIYIIKNIPLNVVFSGKYIWQLARFPMYPDKLQYFHIARQPYCQIIRMPDKQIARQPEYQGARWIISQIFRKPFNHIAREPYSQIAIQTLSQMAEQSDSQMARHPYCYLPVKQNCRMTKQKPANHRAIKLGSKIYIYFFFL